MQYICFLPEENISWFQKNLPKERKMDAYTNFLKHLAPATITNKSKLDSLTFPQTRPHLSKNICPNMKNNKRPADRMQNVPLSNWRSKTKIIVCLGSNLNHSTVHEYHSPIQTASAVTSKNLQIGRLYTLPQHSIF